MSYKKGITTPETPERKIRGPTLVQQQPILPPPSELTTQTPTFKKELANSFYVVAAFGEECRLSLMAGLEYLREILEANGESICIEIPEYNFRETLSAFSLGKLKAAAKDLEAGASAAWSRGDRDLYDSLNRERIALRKYQTECFGTNGRAKRFQTNATRKQHAATEAIRRAIEAIRKTCPGIAAHLRKYVHSAASAWKYSGGIEWNTKWAHAEIDEFFSSDEALSPDEIQTLWKAESTDPSRELTRRTPMQGARTQLEKMQVLRDIRQAAQQATKRFPRTEALNRGRAQGVSKTPVIHRRCGRRMPDEDEEIASTGCSVLHGDPVCLCGEKLRVSHGILSMEGKSFVSARDPYSSRGSLEEYDNDEHQIKDEAEKARRGQEANTFELGDGRGSEDFTEFQR